MADDNHNYATYPSLAGRGVLITGGGSGIGKATAERVASEGANVVIVDMNLDAGTAVAEAVNGIAVQADVTDAADVARTFQTAFDTYGSIDVSFHNAGISPPDDDSILTTGIEAWDRVQKVNLTSVYLCCKEVIPYMQRQGKGAIINTASFVATMGAATSQISYTASKGAISAWTRSLAVEVAEAGIRVNAVAPGQVLTKLVQQGLDDGSIIRDSMLSEVPMRRFGKPEEIAGVVAFIAPNDCRSMTGPIVPRNGGRTI